MTLVGARAEWPSPLTVTGPLVGRGRELETVVGLLTDPAVSTVVLTGPSGVGKTTLALHALDAVPATSRVVVPLGAMRDADVMGDAITAQVGVTEPGLQRPGEALWSAFGGAPVVLLLDEVDQVSGVAEVVGAILDVYPAARVVATSVQAPGVPGERVVRLAPLAVSPASGPTDPLDPDTGPPPAVRLLLERAGTRRVGAAPGPADVDAAGRIARAVGGLPLAVELAAARAGTMPLATIAAQLERSGGLSLLDGAPNADGAARDRHSSLHAALSWTAGLLPAPAADLLAAMSVFEGPATLEAVAAVAPPGEPALDLLATLLDLCLVEVDGSEPEEPLFWLLPTVRAFAAERLAAGGARDAVVARHDWFVQARCHDGHPLRPHEVSDVLATLDRARLTGAVDAALDLALHAARVTRAPGARASVGSLLAELIDGEPADDDVLATRALVWSVTHRPADVPDREAYAADTRDRVDRAIRTARTSGDRASLLDALELTIRTLPVTLDLDLARSGIQEGLALAEEAGDAARLARFRMWVGMATLAEGLVPQAERLLRLAFAGGTASGDRVAADYAATHLHSIGVTETGEPPRPLPSLDALLDRAWQHRDGYASAIILAQLVARALDAGDVRSAARHTSQLLGFGAERQVVEPLVGATILTVVVRVLVAAGELVDAAVLQSTLAPLEAPLQRALSVEQLHAYRAAVDRLAAQQVPAPAPTPSLREAFRLAEKAVVRVVTDAGGGTAATAARRAGQTTPVASDPRRPEPAEVSLGRLTSREREVLALLAEGSGNRQVAEALGISSKTVMHHTVAIYRKLGVRGRTEAAAWAIRAGLTPTD